MSKATTSSAEPKNTATTETSETTAPDAPEAPDASEIAEFYVAPGKAVTSLKGILSGDTADKITPEDLAGGKDAFEALRKIKHILRS